MGIGLETPSSFRSIGFENHSILSYVSTFNEHSRGEIISHLLSFSILFTEGFNSIDCF